MKEFTYEPSKDERVEEDDDDDDDEYDDDDNFVEDESHEYGRENVGSVASVYLMPYVYKGRFLDTQYGVRKDGDLFMIGDSHIVVDTVGDITIEDRVFKESKGLLGTVDSQESEYRIYYQRRSEVIQENIDDD